jgi:alanine racemase
LSQVDEISLMTHFSDADGERGIAHQITVFNQLTADLPGERSVANSAALLRSGRDAHVSADWVRPGIALYGGAPDYPEQDAAHWGLQPVMSLRSRLIAIQTLAVGDTVGYGSTFTAPRAMTIGVVACGYADGYPRSAPTGTPVLVQGQRVGLVGRVSMDMLTVDLTDWVNAGQAAGLGAEVTLWGRASSGERLDVDEVAHRAGTIGYELLCALAPRVPVDVE